MKPSLRNSAILSAVITAVAQAGCGLILGLDEYTLVEDSSGNECEPLSKATCYDGAQGTEGVGICKAGTKTCNSDGTAYDACVDQVQPQPETCENPDDEDCNGYECVVWSKLIGDASDQFGGPVVLDGEGNVFMAGSFAGSIDLGDGTPLYSGSVSDIFLAKLDPTGVPLWSKQISGTGSHVVNDVVVAADGSVVLVGNFYQTINLGKDTYTTAPNDSDIFVVKYDAAGNVLWSRQMASPQTDRALSIALTSSADVVLAGFFQATSDFGSGSITNLGISDILVAKLSNSDGHTIWSKGFGNTSIEEASSVAVDYQDNILLVGHFFQDPLNLGGQDLAPAGPETTFYAKFDKDGNHLWSHRLGAATPGEVAVTPAGDVVFSATFDAPLMLGIGTIQNNGKTDVLIAKAGSGGGLQWARGFGGPDAEDYGRVAIDLAGNVYLGFLFGQEVVVGASTLVSAGSTDVAVAKLNVGGNIMWSRRFGSSKGDGIDGLAVSPTTGGPVLTGYVSDSIDFGEGAHVHQGGTDAFLATFGP